MSCFFACFGIKHRRSSRLLTNFRHSSNKDAFMSNNQLATMHLYEGSSEEVSDVKDAGHNERKNEETPAHIRQVSERTSIQNINEDRLPAGSFLFGMPYRKLNKCKQLGQVFDSSEQEQSSFQECEPKCSSPGESQTLKDKKAEGLEQEHQLESGRESIILNVSPSEIGSHIKQSVSSHSHHVTPFNLSDEMETPETIGPSNLENYASTHTQYMHPDSKLGENLSQWNSLRNQPVPLNDIPGQEKNSWNSERMIYHNSPSNNSGMHGLACISIPNEMKNANQVTDLKERSENDMNWNSMDSREQVHSNPASSQFIDKGHQYSMKIPDADRPIIGLVAAYWSSHEEPRQISPKWWDGNGIPNSTNKYKEDQKVSWHDISFEERLEKALSDENLLPQREPLDRKDIDFEKEGHESDKAAS